MKNPLKLFKEIFSIKDSPKSIAKGFALGSFIGMIPIPGFQVFVAYGLSKLFKTNTKSACIAVFNTNLFTGVFIFGFNYWLGKKVLGITSDFLMPNKINFHFVNSILMAGREVYLSLLIGGVITGLITSALTFYIVKYYITIKRKRLYKQYDT